MGARQGQILLQRGGPLDMIVTGLLQVEDPLLLGEVLLDASRQLQLLYDSKVTKL